MFLGSFICIVTTFWMYAIYSNWIFIPRCWTSVSSRTVCCMGWAAILSASCTRKSCSVSCPPPTAQVSSSFYCTLVVIIFKILWISSGLKKFHIWILSLKYFDLCGRTGTFLKQNRPNNELFCRIRIQSNNSDKDWASNPTVMLK